jgi:hypothetical protein
MYKRTWNFYKAHPEIQLRPPKVKRERPKTDTKPVLVKKSQNQQSGSDK